MTQKILSNFGFVLYCMNWSGLVWSGLVWSGLAWSGLVWSGLVWFGLAWPGLACPGLSQPGLGFKLAVIRSEQKWDNDQTTNDRPANIPNLGQSQPPVWLSWAGLGLGWAGLGLG